MLLKSFTYIYIYIISLKWNTSFPSVQDKKDLYYNFQEGLTVVCLPCIFQACGDEAIP